MATSITGQPLQVYQVPDDTLSGTSKNTVQNKVVTNAIGDLSELKTKTKSNLVGAVNDIAMSSGAGVDMNDYAPVIETTNSTGYGCYIVPISATAANRPIKELEFELEPKRSGTGTPSSENVRELSGWTDFSMLMCSPYFWSMEVNNLLLLFTETLNRSGSGTPSPENPMPIIPIITFERDDGSVLSVYYASLGSAMTGEDFEDVRHYVSDSVAYVQIKDLEWSMPSESIFSCTISDAQPGYQNSTFPEGCSIYESVSGYDSESTLLASIENNKFGFVKNSKKRYIKDTRYTSVEDFVAGVGEELLYYRVDYSNRPDYILSIEEFARALDNVNERLYEARGFNYSYYTRKIDWSQIAGTIYGGKVTIDKDGNVTVTKEWNIIASYNNEALPGKWLSSKDEYAEGTTPTVGAQVAYKLEAPAATYHLNIEPMFTYGGNDMLIVDGDCDRNSHKITYQMDTAQYVLTLGYVTVNDYATSYQGGVVKVQNVHGLKVTSGQTAWFNNGILQIDKATDAKVKAGTDTYMPIVPANQKNSVFYGLAAAAGDTTQKSSNNAVGNYTDTAKTKIKTMLGAASSEELTELRNEITALDGLGITGATVGQIIKVLTVDGNGKPLTWQAVDSPQTEVSVVTPASTTVTLSPCPVTYAFGEAAALNLTVTATSQYHFSFSCPSASVTVLTLNGITGTAGDDIEAGGTYEVDVWAGTAFIKEIEITAVT